MLEADAGEHRTIVNVPATAIDADTGLAVGSAFTMIAPASGASGAQSLFVSPLTTLVQQQMDATGQTVVQSNDFIQALLGLAVAPLSDYTTTNTVDNAKIANAAKLVLQAQRQQATAVASALGQMDVSGASITQVDLDRAVLGRVIEGLPAIGAAAADPAVLALSGIAREDRLAAAAAGVVAQIGFTPEQAKFAIGLPRLPQAQASATPTEGANMVALQYGNAADWFFRYNASTAADNTPDANGKTRSYAVRIRMAPYAYQPGQGVATAASRTFNPELHWNGTAWGTCEVGDRDINTPRDALGRATYATCNNFESGFSQRGEIDIAGQTLASVWTNRIVPEVAKTNSLGAWTLPDVALLGTTAVYPAGSRLFLQSNTTTATAPTYNTSDTNRVVVFSDAVAQGGDARVSTVACSNAGTGVLAVSLEEVVARNPGKPCIFNQATNADGTSLNPNEAWGPSTASLGSIPNGNTLPAGTGNYYTTTAPLRVAFTGTGNATTYYRCYERRTPASNRNCTPIGTGSYSIATLGDARVMSFANLPAEAVGLNSTRVFVERGGAVYFGFKNKVGANFTSVRLNLPAANALLFQLRMPAIQVLDAPQPLTGSKGTTAATLKGAWAVVEGNTAAVLRFGDNGEYLMAQASPPDSGGRPGFELGWFEFDPTTSKGGMLQALDSNGEWGFSHPLPATVDGITSITDTAINFADGLSIARLPNEPNGIVGMWALGSATDLKATHFVFFANGKVLSIHPAESEGSCATNRQGPPGIEWSDYTWNAGTGALRIFNKIHDTSGCTGAFDSAAAVPNTEANLVITLAADKQTFTVPVDGGAVTVTFHRIAPNP